MKLIKITLSIVTLLIVVCVLGISALIYFIDPNKLKPVIAAELKKQSGYEVVMDGDFSWSFYPRIGVKADHIALFMPKQTSAFIDLHGITFVTALSELIQGKQKLQGDVYIADVKLLNLHAEKAHVGLRWQNQVLTMQPISANLYDGKLEGSAHGSHLSDVPRWDWDIQAANIQLSPLMQDVSSPNSKIKMTGVGAIKVRAATQGKTREQILSNLNGTNEFNLKNGTVEGIDLNYLVKSADALINKQPLVVPADISRTEFESLIGTAVIKNGVAGTNDLTLTSPALLVNGAGSINLILQAINLQLRVAPQKEAKTHWVIPVMITGDLYRPDVRLDATEINIMIAKEKLDKVKGKLKEEIKSHVSGKAGELLQNLLGN